MLEKQIVLIFHLWLSFEEIVRSDIATHLDLGRRKRSQVKEVSEKFPGLMRVDIFQ